MIRTVETTVKNADSIGRRAEAHIHSRDVGKTTVETVELRPATHKDYASGKLIGTKSGIFYLFVDICHNLSCAGGHIVVYLNEINSGHIMDHIRGIGIGKRIATLNLQILCTLFKNIECCYIAGYMT